MANPDILSQRYASDEINEIFSERGKTIAERGFWIEVMKAQRQLGLDIPSEVIEAFEAAKENPNLDRIKEIELDTRHDIKAKIQGFVEEAGTEQKIHKNSYGNDKQRPYR